ncbi:MAG: sigma-E factor regulatory protein RseB domain-containing protein, partial [Trebonia sp.]
MSLLRRPVLLLSAAATVAIPGALAAFAVFGHDDTVRTSMASAESVAAQSGNQQQASTRRTGSSAVTAAQADLFPGLTSAGPDLPQSDMRTGAAAAIIADARNQAQGVQLLRAAAKSGAAVSYQGVELISDAAVGGTATAVAKVWHRGGVTVTQTAGAAAGESEGTAAVNDSQPYVSYDGDVHDPGGVFGLTTPLVGLLAKNYVAMYGGEGTAVGRPALVVEVRRADGSLAAQFWLDKQTMLPLRRAVYDARAHLVSDDKFVQVSFAPMSAPTAGPASAAQAAVPAWA